MSANDAWKVEARRCFGSPIKSQVVLGSAGAVEEFARTLPAKEKPLVYLCAGNACQAPTSEAAEVKKNLSLR